MHFAKTEHTDRVTAVRELPMELMPHAEYWLDWFHVTLRLTTMGQQAKGVRAETYADLSADLEEMLAHLKWNLWHGKVDRALVIADELVYALDVEGGSPEHRKLLKAVRAFETYVTNNRAFVPNYGERYRQGKPISTPGVFPGGWSDSPPTSGAPIRDTWDSSEKLPCSPEEQTLKSGGT